MPVKNPKYFSLGKNKVKDIIKEEDELNEGSGDDKRHKSYKSKKNIFSEDSSSSDEEKENKKNARRKNTKEMLEKKQNEIKEMINKILKRANISENIISLKENQLYDLKYLIIILDKREKKNEFLEIYLTEAKKNIPIYKEIQNIKNKKMKTLKTI